MNTYPKLWWRIAGVLLLAVPPVGGAALAAAYLLLGRGHLVQLPAERVLTFEVEAHRARRAAPPDQLLRKSAEVFDRRLSRAGLPRIRIRLLEPQRIQVRWAIRKGVDPNQVAGMLLRPGVLEFRIAADGGDGRGVPLDRAERNRLLEDLRRRGPGSTDEAGRRFVWLPVRGAAPKPFVGLVVEEYGGQPCVLLSNEPNHALLYDAPDRPWSIEEAFRSSDSFGMPAVGFRFDEAGARQFHRLTSSHIGKQLAIVLDDEALSAPRIQDAISERGVISGRFTLAEVGDLVSVLSAEPLPAPVRLTAGGIRRAPPADPPNATAKRVILGLLAAAAAALAAMGLRAIRRARVGAFGLWAVLLLVAAQGWWEVVAWGNGPARVVCYLAWILHALVLVALLAVWTPAAVLAPREPKAGDEPPADRPACETMEDKTFYG